MFARFWTVSPAPKRRGRLARGGVADTSEDPKVERSAREAGCEGPGPVSASGAARLKTLPLRSLPSSRRRAVKTYAVVDGSKVRHLAKST